MMAYPPHQQQPRQMQQMPGQQMMGQPQAAPGFPPGAHINPQVYPGFGEFSSFMIILFSPKIYFSWWLCG